MMAADLDLELSEFNQYSILEPYRGSIEELGTAVSLLDGQKLVKAVHVAVRRSAVDPSYDQTVILLSLTPAFSTLTSEAHYKAAQELGARIQAQVPEGWSVWLFQAGSPMQRKAKRNGTLLWKKGQKIRQRSYRPAPM